MAELGRIQDAQTNQHNDQAEQAELVLRQLLHGSQNPFKTTGKRALIKYFISYDSHSPFSSAFSKSGSPVISESVRYISAFFFL